MDYFLNAGILGGIFAVPNSVVDNYIKLANEASIKVLLYVLRNNEQNLPGSVIANALNLTENQVEEAFVFWENANVFPKAVNDTNIRTATENISQVKETVSKPVQNAITTIPVPAEPKKKIVQQERADYNINPSEIAERVKSSEDIRCLFSMSEQTFARPLTHTEQRGLIWIHDYLGLSTEVLLMLTAFCISLGKSSIKYIEKVAIDWAERDVNTLERAEKEIRRVEESQSYNGKILKLFEMDRKFTSKEQNMVNMWRERNYNIDLIKCAYEKTLEKTNKLSIAYLNGILENWYTDGIRTPEQIDNDKQTDVKMQSNEYSFDLNEYKSLVNNFGDE